MMPEMSGRDFAAWLEKTSPTTKVVFVSGYLDHSLQFAEHCDHELHFLPKPFDPEQLALKVRQALDS
jgi:two-component system cell cycle sensor histidine kinase/response regulator CckA